MKLIRKGLVINAVHWKDSIPWFYTNEGVFRGGYSKKGIAFNHFLGRGIIALSECKAVM